MPAMRLLLLLVLVACARAEPALTTLPILSDPNGKVPSPSPQKAPVEREVSEVPEDHAGLTRTDILDDLRSAGMVTPEDWEKQQQAIKVQEAAAQQQLTAQAVHQALGGAVDPNHVAALAAMAAHPAVEASAKDLKQRLLTTNLKGDLIEASSNAATTEADARGVEEDLGVVRDEEMRIEDHLTAVADSQNTTNRRQRMMEGALGSTTKEVDHARDQVRAVVDIARTTGSELEANIAIMQRMAARVEATGKLAEGDLAAVYKSQEDLLQWARNVTRLVNAQAHHLRRLGDDHDAALTRAEILDKRNCTWDE